jgi:hypothetical protein
LGCESPRDALLKSTSVVSSSARAVDGGNLHDSEDKARL